MATQTHAHTHARRQAVQVLYQHELTGCSLEELASADFGKSAGVGIGGAASAGAASAGSSVGGGAGGSGAGTGTDGGAGGASSAAGTTAANVGSIKVAAGRRNVFPFSVPVYPEGVSDNDLIAAPLSDYAKCLIRGVAAHEKQIDEDIIKTAENWALDRMPIVDRNIIRVAVYEIAYEEDIPTGVAINEAVEEAKLYCGSDSPKFVNGILGRIAILYDETAVDPEKNNDDAADAGIVEEDNAGSANNK